MRMVVLMIIILQDGDQTGWSALYLDLILLPYVGNRTNKYPASFLNIVVSFVTTLALM